MKTQQTALYAAERTVPWGYQFAGLAEVQKFLDDLRDNWWWPRRVAQVEAFTGGRIRHPAQAELRPDGCGEITFREDTPALHVVLHELAHVLTNSHYGGSGHHPWFARTLLELTFLVRGSDAYAALAEAFTRAEIDFDAPGVVDQDAVRA